MTSFNAQQADPVVSVVIAAYNAAGFIRRCLDSALSQTLQSVEVIVVNDGSKDMTRQIAEQEYSGRVKLLNQSNAGVSRARNAGIREAKGRYIAFLDADDWWEPSKLELQVRCMEEYPEATANYTGLIVVDVASGEQSLSSPRDPHTLWPLLRWCNPGIVPSSVMVRSTTLAEVGGFNEGLLASEDWELWFKLIQRGRLTALQAPLTFYLSSPSGLSGDADLMYSTFLQIVESPLLDGLRGISKNIWRRRIASYQAYRSCLTARAARDGEKERRYMWLSIRSWPSPFWASERFRAFAVTLVRSR